MGGVLLYCGVQKNIAVPFVAENVLLCQHKGTTIFNGIATSGVNPRLFQCYKISLRWSIHITLGPLALRQYD